jgi:hypothetical protein
MRCRAIRAAALALGAALAGAAHAQEVGRVTHLQGVAAAHRPGGDPRFLSAGDAIEAGEVVSTSGRGYAVVGLTDGTRMTLRANTTFAVTALSQAPGQENLAMNLIRGGLRALTGLISKARPDAARLTTPTATVGIRGTEFDARLCGPECRDEGRFVKPAPPAADQALVVARIAVINGQASATGPDGASRALAAGAALYTGDSVRTAPLSHVVIAFRDQTRVTVIADSAVRLDDVRFPRGAPPSAGNMVLRLVEGGLRAFTGLIARTDRERMRFVTPTATVGIRGTGTDLRVLPDGSYATTWEGAIGLAANLAEVLIERGRAGVHRAGAAAPELLDAIPPFFAAETAPRPDGVEVDFDALFAVRRFEDFAPGLYVGVRGGNVGLAARGGTLDLGPMEAGALLDGSDTPVRVEPLPGFLFNDVFPLPDDTPPRTVRLIELMGPGRLSGSDQCLLQ